MGRIGAPDPATLLGEHGIRTVELLRGDLTALLWEATRHDIEYVFDDAITGLDEHDEGIEVTFRRGTPRRFDLVIGADGLHFAVRRLAFGPEERFRRDLDACYAAFSAPNAYGLDREAVMMARLRATIPRATCAPQPAADPEPGPGEGTIDGRPDHRRPRAGGEDHRGRGVPRVIRHEVRVRPSEERLERTGQLAWAIAEVAAERVAPDPDVADMVINRVIDDVAVAAASLARHAPTTARDQALRHPATPGAAVWGTPTRVSPEWAAWANGTAVRELDFHDTFLAADYSHPGDTIPPLLAVAQHVGATGADLLNGIVTAYEIQVALVRAICLHEHGIDHVAHLGPSVVAGLGTTLALDPETIWSAVGQALHTTTATRQSRKGEISSWKAFAPAFAGKVAVEAVDRAMRGEGAPNPIYEGEDGVVAGMLDGPTARYTVALPAPGEPRRAIMDTFTKEHSAEYQSQALIDLARRLRTRDDVARIREVVIETSHHTHHVIGSGANDPQKYDPNASRETLDHSLPYIIAVALQDGDWHHERSYAPERAARPDTVELWRRIRTVEDPRWTGRYHAAEPEFGGRVVIVLDDGTEVADEIAVADAHPRGARPFGREQYVEKFRTLADDVVDEQEQERFLDLVTRLPGLGAHGVRELTITAGDLPTGASGLF